MFFRQYYLGCLSHASYLIGDETTGRAVVVDPQRDISGYLTDAAGAGLDIERVIETHFHADFVSGHLEMAASTGASISYGDGAEADFPIDHLSDGEHIELGQVVLETRATPGHTPESVSVVIYEHAGDEVPYGVLTGDALFIGDVGRPDLTGGGDLTADDMARQLYRSLHGRLLTLPDPTRVFPAHGAGSACGKHLSTETVSTIGEQRRVNYALAPMSEDDFVAIVTEGQVAAPAYFSFDAHRNREARGLLGEAELPPPLALDELLALQGSGGVVLDSRRQADFTAAHLRGSIGVGLEGRFAEYAGDVIGPEQAVALICEPGTEVEARVRLARIGFDRVAGYLRDPVPAFLSRPELIEASSRLTAAELAQRMADVGDLVLIDVRNPGELARGGIEDAVGVPLATLVDRIAELDPSRPTVAYCASGFRSQIAASVLASSGFDDVSDLLGGYEAWSAHQVNRRTPGDLGGEPLG